MNIPCNKKVVKFLWNRLQIFIIMLYFTRRDTPILISILEKFFKMVLQGGKNEKTIHTVNGSNVSVWFSRL